MIGFWKMLNDKGFITHTKGLSQVQVDYLKNLKVGDRLVIFKQDVREGETQAVLNLKRSNLEAKEGINETIKQ